MAQDFQNPFVHISHWVKGEVYALEALQCCYDDVMQVPNQKKEALEAGLLIREGIFGALTDNAVGHMLKDLERGNILQSKANKTGFAWFDKPRIAMGTFLSTLETNDIRDAVVNGTMPNEEYDRIRELLEDAYSKYTNIALYQDTWNATQKEYKVVQHQRSNSTSD